MKDQSHTTLAVFIDQKNLWMSHKEFDECLLGEALLSEFGPIVLGKTYWAFGYEDDPHPFPGWKVPKLFKLGIEIIPIPSFKGKNMADGKIMVDIINAVGCYPNIDLWVIASNDKDFLPVIEELRRRGQHVLLIYNDTTGILLEACERLGVGAVMYQSIVPQTHLAKPNQNSISSFKT